MALPSALYSFRAKLMALSVGLVTLPLGAAGVSLIGVNADTVKTGARDLQLALIEDVARTIDTQLGDVERAVREVARALADGSQPEAARLGMARVLVEASDAVDQVAVFDASGAYLDRLLEPGSPAGPLALTPELIGAAEAQVSAFGPVEIMGGDPRLLVVVAVRAGGKVTGFVASPASLGQVQGRIERLTEGRFPGGTGALFVLDERQRVIAHPDRERAQALAPVDDGVLAWADPRHLPPGVARSGEYRDRSGRVRVGSIQRLERRPWSIVAEVDRAVAYASLDRMEQVALAILLGSLLLSIVVATLVARQLSRPVQQLSEYAGELAERRFDRRLELKSRDELSVLARAMSGAAADLAESEARIREEVAIRSDLGRYLPSALVEKVVKREQDMALGGERRSISVLFADVVGFTPLTERLGAEEVVALLNELFTILTEIVFRHGGTVDKFVGDCVMAIWGAPTGQEDHARRALAAAQDMIEWLEAGNAAWQARLGVQVELAIGVNSGDAIVGNVGSDTRMEYTAIGDVVNVAARLEAIARPRQILVTRATRDAVGDASVRFLDLGERTLPGRPQPIRLFEVRP